MYFTSTLPYRSWTRTTQLTFQQLTSEHTALRPINDPKEKGKEKKLKMMKSTTIEESTKKLKK